MCSHAAIDACSEQQLAPQPSLLFAFVLPFKGKGNPFGSILFWGFFEKDGEAKGSCFFAVQKQKLNPPPPERCRYIEIFPANRGDLEKYRARATGAAY